MEKVVKQQGSEAETQSFVELWCTEEVQANLNSATRNKPVFESLQREMADAAYTRTVDQPVNKLKKIKKDFCDQKREMGPSGSGRVVRPHFEMLNAVLGDRPANAGTGATCSATHVSTLEETAIEPDVSSGLMECPADWAASPGPSCSSILSSSSYNSSIASSAAAMGKRKRDSWGEVLQYLEKADEASRVERMEEREISRAILQCNSNMDAQATDMAAMMRRMVSVMEQGKK